MWLSVGISRSVVIKCHDIMDLYSDDPNKAWSFCLSKYSQYVSEPAN